MMKMKKVAKIIFLSLSASLICWDVQNVFTPKKPFDCALQKLGGELFEMLGGL